MRCHLTSEFAVSCDTQSKRLKGELTALQVGRIPVSPAWVTDWLADNLPSGVSMEGATLSVPSALPLVLLGGEQTLAALEITQAVLSTEGIEFTFTVNANGTSQRVSYTHLIMKNPVWIVFVCAKKRSRLCLSSAFPARAAMSLVTNEFSVS